MHGDPAPWLPLIILLWVPARGQGLSARKYPLGRYCVLSELVPSSIRFMAHDWSPQLYSAPRPRLPFKFLILRPRPFNFTTVTPETPSAVSVQHGR